jgi:putative AlgH/UPF0301 family transcriptional regulator
VVLIISHDAGGTVGLILNRPTGLVLGRKSGGLPFDMAGGPPGLQEVFAENRVYCGGFLAQQVGGVRCHCPMRPHIRVRLDLTAGLAPLRLRSRPPE